MSIYTNLCVLDALKYLHNVQVRITKLIKLRIKFGMEKEKPKLGKPAIGIDLGTTYYLFRSLKMND